MVPAPSATADQSACPASPGTAASFSRVPPGACTPPRAYSCPAISTSPIPASIPCTTATEIARNHRPSRSAPMHSCSNPAASTRTPSARAPCVCTAS